MYDFINGFPLSLEHVDEGKINLNIDVLGMYVKKLSYGWAIIILALHIILEWEISYICNHQCL